MAFKVLYTKLLVFVGFIMLTLYSLLFLSAVHSLVSRFLNLSLVFFWHAKVRFYTLHTDGTQHFIISRGVFIYWKNSFFLFLFLRRGSLWRAWSYLCRPGWPQTSEIWLSLISSLSVETKGMHCHASWFLLRTLQPHMIKFLLSHYEKCHLFMGFRTATEFDDTWHGL